MPIEKTMEGIVAIVIIFIFITAIIPALVDATGISLWWITPSMFLIVIGIIFAIVREWIN